MTVNMLNMIRNSYLTAIGKIWILKVISEIARVKIGSCYFCAFVYFLK